MRNKYRKNNMAATMSYEYCDALLPFSHSNERDFKLITTTTTATMRAATTKRKKKTQLYVRCLYLCLSGASIRSLLA